MPCEFEFYIQSWDWTVDSFEVRESAEFIGKLHLSMHFSDDFIKGCFGWCNREESIEWAVCGSDSKIKWEGIKNSKCLNLLLRHVW